MSFLRKFQRMLCAVLALSFLTLSVHQTAVAAIITTEELVTAKELDLKREQIRDWMARDDVRDQLVARGVDPEQAKTRVDNMTDSEVITVAGKIDEMPAGGDALTVVLIIFLVLVITDLLGVTDVFTFVKKK